MLTRNSVFSPQAETLGQFKPRTEKTATHSDIKAALPRTVSSTARYSVVPQNQCPLSRPFDSFKSPHHRITEKPNNI